MSTYSATIRWQRNGAAFTDQRFHNLGTGRARTRRTVSATSSGSEPPLVSHSVTQSAPASAAAATVASA
jgi:hypothetical protein